MKKDLKILSYNYKKEIVFYQKDIKRYKEKL